MLPSHFCLPDRAGPPTEAALFCARPPLGQRLRAEACQSGRAERQRAHQRASPSRTVLARLGGAATPRCSIVAVFSQLELSWAAHRGGPFFATTIGRASGRAGQRFAPCPHKRTFSAPGDRGGNVEGYDCVAICLGWLRQEQPRGESAHKSKGDPEGPPRSNQRSRKPDLSARPPSLQV
jgi:hypothetical protein